MPTRMTPKEKASYYGGRIHQFEHANGWSVGKYAVSEIVGIVAVILLLAWALPRVIASDTLLAAGMGVIILLILYILLIFLLSGGRGRVVDVLNM